MKPAEFHYRTGWRTAGTRPGSHPGRLAGSGQLFRQLAPLLAQPDPRRLDLRASLTDPFETWWVRLYQQRSAIAVQVLADLSGSMGYRGTHPKLAVLADFIEALAVSVYRAGDTLGVRAAADRIYRELSLPPARQPGPAFQLAQRLRRFRPPGVGCSALLEAARSLPGRRSLVLVLSDFHFPLSFAKQLLAALARHDVVPVVLWDPAEALPEASGLARLVDLEGGGARLLMLRPALRQRLADNIRDRRARLIALCRKHGREPLLLPDGFDPHRVSRYFLGVR